MQETIQNIVERVNFEKKEDFTSFLNKCVQISTETAKSTYAIHDNILFKIDVFFSGLATFLNNVKKEKRFLLGVETVEIVLDELGFEIEKEDAFILFHLRELGKFRIKDVKLHEQLKGLWGEHKDFFLEDQEFSHTIKTLMRMGLIDYRKGNLNLRKGTVISYRN